MTDSPNYAFVCDYVSRHFPKTTRILDFGCGDGSLSALLMKEGFDVSGVDILDEAANWLRDLGCSEEVRAKFKYGNYIDMIPFGDRMFDVVVANVVFEHIEKFPVLVPEFARVLDKGGVLLASFPTRESIIEAHARLPFLHKVGRGRLRKAYLKGFGRWGLRKSPAAAEEYAAGYINYIDYHTFYRPRRYYYDHVRGLFSIQDITSDYLRVGSEYLITHRKGRKHIIGRMVNVLCRSGLFCAVFSRYGMTFWALTKKGD